MNKYPAGLPRHIQQMLDGPARPKNVPYWNTRKPGTVPTMPAHHGYLTLPTVQDDPWDDPGDPWDPAARPVGLTGQ